VLDLADGGGDFGVVDLQDERGRWRGETRPALRLRRALPLGAVDRQSSDRVSTTTDPGGAFTSAGADIRLATLAIVGRGAHSAVGGRRDRGCVDHACFFSSNGTWPVTTPLGGTWSIAVIPSFNSVGSFTILTKGQSPAKACLLNLTTVATETPRGLFKEAPGSATLP
jgi:hypothetical protein